MDDERLKNPDLPYDYFEELIKRIQDIITSERRFYQKITDIYAISTDYDPTDENSILFFQIVQNKMHWAIKGKKDIWLRVGWQGKDLYVKEFMIRDIYL